MTPDPPGLPPSADDAFVVDPDAVRRWTEKRAEIFAAALEGVPARALVREVAQVVAGLHEGVGSLCRAHTIWPGHPSFGSFAGLPGAAMSALFDHGDDEAVRRCPAERAIASADVVHWPGDDPDAWGPAGPALRDAGFDRARSIPVSGRRPRPLASLTLFWKSEHFDELPPELARLLYQAVDQLRAILENEIRRGVLTESEERLSLALASTQESVYDWFIPEGRVLLDHRWCEMVGISPSELKGDLSDWSDHLHPADAPRVEETLDRCLRGDQPEYEAEYRVRHRTGDWIWLQARGRVVARDRQGRPLRMAGTMLDITERRRQSEELERLRAAVSALNDIVVITDPATGMEDAPTIRFVNDAVERISGIPPESLVGATTVDLFGRIRGSEEALRDARARLLKGEATRSVFEFARPDGTPYWLEVVTQPSVHPESGQGFWVSVARDVTERRTAEMELAESREQLRHAQKMEAVGRLAGGMAHDFNNLLTAILGYGEFIGDEAEPGSTLRQDADEIVRAATRGQAITRQLLAFSRKNAWQPSTMVTSDVVRGIDRLIGRLIGEDISVEVLPAVTSGWIEADRNQLEQAVVNLVINARDALSAGGTVTVETGSLDLDEPLDANPEPVPAGAWESISVSDDGVGIAPAMLQHVFEPFFTTKEAGRGTGLGLATVYGTVRQCDGYVTVESTPGEGSTFRLLLPRRTVEVAPEATLRKAMGDRVGGTETILLVEDEAQVRDFAVRTLRRVGYRVLQARHGRDALMLWEEHRDDVALVLTDVVMPTMGGVELAREIRSRSPDVRILFMSGYTGDSLRIRTEENSLDPRDLVSKPFATPELLSRVRERLDRPED